MVKRFSIYLTFASCASFVLVLTAIGLLIIEYKRGTVQEIYDNSLCTEERPLDEDFDVLFCTKPLKIVMVGFQVLTLLTTGIVFCYHLEKALKCSYGYQKMENNHLAIIIAAIGTICLFLTATVTTIINMKYVLSIGAFLVIDAVAVMFISVTLYKQREKMEEFVETILSANRAEGLPLTEQHAHDLCKMQAGDQEFKQLVRQGKYWNYFENMRVAEYYYLQKWCAELERLKRIENDVKAGIRIDGVLKEMQERAQIFGLNDVEALRWRELASFQKLIIPEDTYDMQRSSSSNFGEYSVPHQRLHNHYHHIQPTSNNNAFHCDHEILQHFY